LLLLLLLQMEIQAFLFLIVIFNHLKFMKLIAAAAVADVSC